MQRTLVKIEVTTQSKEKHVRVLNPRALIPCTREDFENQKTFLDHKGEVHVVI